MIGSGGLLPLRFRGFWLGMGVVALALGIAIALAPLNAPLPLLTEDKTVHFIGFLILTVWFLGIVELRLHIQIALLLAIYGVLIEILQSFTAYRVAEPYDVLANVAGIGTGWLLSAAGLRHWCRRLETLLGASAS